MHSDDVRALESVKQFVAAMERYCALLDAHSDYAFDDFITRLLETMTALYQAALALPELSCFDSHSSFQPPPPYSQSRSLYAKFGDYRSYWQV